MFAWIRTVGTENIGAGEPVVLRFDTEYGRIAAFGIGGDSYGFLCERQPEGCVDECTMYARIGDRRVLGRAAVVFDGGLLVNFDSPVFASAPQYVRVEKAGYGMLVPA